MERVKVRKNKSEVILSFNYEVYDKKAIEQAMHDFEEFGLFKEERDSIIIIPKDKKTIKEIGYEFYNYVLGLMKV